MRRRGRVRSGPASVNRGVGETRPFCREDGTRGFRLVVGTQPVTNSVCQRVEKCELVVVVPMADDASVRCVHGYDPERLVGTDQATGHTGLPIKMFVAEVA